MIPASRGLLTRTRDAVSAFRHGEVRPRRAALRPGERHAQPAQYALIWPSYRQGEPHWQMVDFATYVREGFNMNALIYSAVMYKVRQCAMAPLRAYLGNPDDRDPAPWDHEMARLLRRPNPVQSWSQFQGLATAYLNIAGNAFTLIDRPKSGAQPTQLLPLRPDRMAIAPDDQFGIKGYLYKPEGKTWQEAIPLLPEDVSHTKLPNPLDPLEGMGMGLSPLASMAQSGDVDNYLTRFLRMFMENGAMQQNVIILDDEADDAAIQRARERFREAYGGVENWTEPVVLTGGAKIERLSMTFEEMNFEAIDARNETRLLGPLGVPLSLIATKLGSESSTYNNKETERRAFWEDTFLTELSWFEDDYQERLETDEVTVGFDTSGVPALRGDIGPLVVSASSLIDRGVPPRVAFQTVGLDVEEYDHIDTAMVASNLVPMARLLADEEKAEEGPNPTPPQLVPFTGEEDVPVDDAPPDDTPPADDETDTPDGQEQQRLPLSWEERMGGKPPTWHGLPVIVAGELPPPNGQAEADAETAAALRAYLGDEHTTHDTHAHTYAEVDIPCPLCGHSPTHQYADHGDLCICPVCEKTFDPAVWYGSDGEAYARQAFAEAAAREVLGGDPDDDRDWDALDAAYEVYWLAAMARVKANVTAYTDNSARIAQVSQISEADWAEAVAADEAQQAAESSLADVDAIWGLKSRPLGRSAFASGWEDAPTEQHGDPWQPIVDGMTNVQKLVHLAARLDSVAEEAIRSGLLRDRRQVFVDELTQQARRVGCRDAVGFLTEGRILTELNDLCKEDAASIVNTYNRELANQILQIAADTPTANRHVYARRILDWEAQRKVWKDEQIAQYTANTARSLAQQYFYDMNGHNGVAVLEPTMAQCPVCGGWVARGEVPMREAQNNPPPYHAGCVHGWQNRPERMDCADIWVGE